MTFKGLAEEIAPHPMAEYRRVPMKRLMLKLGLTEYHNEGPLVDTPISPKQVRIPLKQHAGAAAAPVVRVGDRVRMGDLLAKPEAGALGARVHCSIDGVVRAVEDAVTVEAG